MLGSPVSLPPVFLPDPVNRHQPLNRGLLGWWLGLPGLEGGRRIYDLMGLNHGTLNAGVAWTPRLGPLGGGALQFSTTSAYVDCGSAPNLQNVTGSLTLVAWVFQTNAAGYQRVLAKESCWYLGLNGGKLTGCCGNGTTWHNFTDSPVAMPLGSWHQVGMTVNAGIYTWFLDGAAVASKTSALDGTNSNSSNIGGPFGESFKGTIDGPAIYGAALGTADFAALYHNAREGYPGRLNRLPSVPAPVSASGARRTATRLGTRSGSRQLSGRGA